MKSALLSAVFACCLLSVCAQKYRDEFNGPFSSWANVKTRFKATGDGVHDDTRALQTALDSLSRVLKAPFNVNEQTRYVVVYLPAGTYRISNTLRLEGRTSVTIIGEDPQKTIIKWYGTDNDTMFFSNKSAHVKISRLTWDANRKNGVIAMGLHFKDNTEPFFAPTFMELSDMIFTGNPLYGLSCGTYAGEGTGNMDSEFTIRRCKFYSATGAGIRIKGFNALDYWIWDCEFNSCSTGIDCSHGNYHVYRSNFLNSSVADCRNKDILYSSVRYCYSENAAVFSLDEGASCTAMKRIFQSNTVKNCRSIAIQYHHQGKITLMDNYIYNQSDSSRQAVDYTSWCNGNYDILSVENSYNKVSPFNVSFPNRAGLHHVEDKKFSAVRSKAPLRTAVQPFLTYSKRTVFEVPVNASGKTIQSIIDKAAALTGKRPVVHFPMSDYFIDAPLEIPAGSDMQLIGDGINASNILTRNTAAAGFYFFIVKGPSYITIKDLMVDKEGNGDHANAFLFTGVDQKGSKIFLDQLHSNTNSTLLIDRLNYTYFEKDNSFFSKGNTVIGGDMVKAGTGTSRLYCFGGQSAGAHLENNATMVARDCWWEGSYRKDYIPLDLKGNGNFTLDGAMYAPNDSDSGTVIQVGNFTGNIALMNMYLSGSINASSAPAGLKMLVWNVNMYRKLNPFDFLRAKTSAQIGMMGITSQCFKSAGVACATEDPVSMPDRLVNISNTEQFLKQLTKDDRNAKPQPFTNLAAGISNIYISRVGAYTGNVAFTFRQ